MTNRPEPYSSPSSAKAPLISNPDGAADHRAITKGVRNVTKVTQGSDAGTAKSNRKKINAGKRAKKIKVSAASPGKKGR